MLSNYITTMLRVIKSHATYYVLSIVGLAVGLATCILILLWVRAEVQYDQFHENRDRIYRVTNRLRIGNMDRSAANTMAPIGPAMVDELDGVHAAVRISIGQSGMRMNHSERQFFEDAVYYADNSIFQVFTFPLIRGDENSALSAPYTAVITAETARKYFGNEDPVGQVLTVDGRDQFTIMGIIEEVPKLSHLQFDILLSFETLYSRDYELMSMWNRIAYFTYVLLDPGVNPNRIEAGMASLVDKYLGSLLKSRGATQELFLQPLADIHLRSSLESDPFAEGNIKQVYLFTGVALIILLVASLNFVNMITARASVRAKEVAMRKVSGATRSQLIVQFLLESIALYLLAMLIGLGIAGVCLPVLNDLVGQSFSISSLLQPSTLLAVLCLAGVTGLLAGAYPAFYLASFRPVYVLKGTVATGQSQSHFRRGLIFFQLAVSVGLLIATLAIQRQISFLTSFDLGFNQDDILVIEHMSDPALPGSDVVKQELGNIDGVRNVTISSSLPGRGGMLSSVIPEGFQDNEAQMVTVISADEDYAATLEMEVVQGRYFSADFPSDSLHSIVINQTAARTFDWSEPVGKTLRFVSRRPDTTMYITKQVVGVLKDWHTESLRSQVGPVVLELSGQRASTLAVKLSSEPTEAVLNELDTEWTAMAPDVPLDYYFLDESLTSSYLGEGRLGRMTLYFSLLAIPVACLGLVGMSAYGAERRAKEFAIRLSLGATVSHLVWLMSRESILLALSAILVAVPLAYRVTNNWLSHFAYQQTIIWTDLLISGLLTLFLALATSGFMALKTALSDPIKALRYE